MNVFTRHAFASAIAAAALVASSAGTASAQTIGTFPFALQPFCNVIQLTVTLEGNTYRLAGWDDACGATTRQPVFGTIAPNGDGTLHLGFTTIRSNGVAVETSIRNLAIGPYTGAWTDSAGNAGTAVIIGVSGAAGTGGARPGPTSTVPTNSVTTVNIVNNSIEAADVNNTQIQLRVGNGCAAGSFIRSIDANGTAVCGGPIVSSTENSPVGALLTTTCEQVASVTLTVPSTGVVTCEGVQHAVINHTNGPDASRITAEIETTTAFCPDALTAGAFEIPAQLATFNGQNVSIPVRRRFDVTAGSFTAYLNSRLWFATTGAQLGNALTCTFTPQ